MQKINLRELYPDIYKTDTFLEVTDEVQAVFLADKRAEPCGARAKRRCRVMTAAPAETRSVPIVRARGKYGE